MNKRALAVAQALFDRTCERAFARGQDPHHKPGTRVETMPPSYLADYLADANAAIAAYEQAMRDERKELLSHPMLRRKLG